MNALHAIYGGLQRDRHLKGFNGDSFVMLVAWNPEERASSFSIHRMAAPLSTKTHPTMRIIARYSWNAN
jgi:hypothetical protein